MESEVVESNPLAVVFPASLCRSRLDNMDGTLSKRVYLLIRACIIDYEILPGSRLVERLIADHLGISRVPVREALRDLARDGFVETNDRRGVVVPRLNRHDLQCLIEVRESLDVLLFTRLSQCLNASMVHEFEELFRQTALSISAGSLSDSIRLNTEFHGLVQRIAGSKTLDQMVDLVNMKLMWLLQKHTTPTLFLEEHQELFRAIKARDDARIRILSKNHLRTVYVQTLATNPHLDT